MDPFQRGASNNNSNDNNQFQRQRLFYDFGGGASSNPQPHHNSQQHHLLQNQQPQNYRNFHHHHGGFQQHHSNQSNNNNNNNNSGRRNGNQGSMPMNDSCDDNNYTNNNNQNDSDSNFSRTSHHQQQQGNQQSPMRRLTGRHQHFGGNNVNNESFQQNEQQQQRHNNVAGAGGVEQLAPNFVAADQKRPRHMATLNARRFQSNNNNNHNNTNSGNGTNGIGMVSASSSFSSPSVSMARGEAADYHDDDFGDDDVDDEDDLDDSHDMDEHGNKNNNSNNNNNQNGCYSGSNSNTNRPQQQQKQQVSSIERRRGADKKSHQSEFSRLERLPHCRNALRSERKTNASLHHKSRRGPNLDGIDCNLLDSISPSPVSAADGGVFSTPAQAAVLMNGDSGGGSTHNGSSGGGCGGGGRATTACHHSNMRPLVARRCEGGSGTAARVLLDSLLSDEGFVDDTTARHYLDTQIPDGMPCTAETVGAAARRSFQRFARGTDIISGQGLLDLADFLGFPARIDPAFTVLVYTLEKRKASMMSTSNSNNGSSSSNNNSRSFDGGNNNSSGTYQSMLTALGRAGRYDKQTWIAAHRNASALSVAALIEYEWSQLKAKFFVSPKVDRTFRDFVEQVFRFFLLNLQCVFASQRRQQQLTAAVAERNERQLVMAHQHQQQQEPGRRLQQIDIVSEDGDRNFSRPSAQAGFIRTLGGLVVPVAPTLAIATAANFVVLQQASVAVADSTTGSNIKDRASNYRNGVGSTTASSSSSHNTTTTTTTTTTATCSGGALLQVPESGADLLNVSVRALPTSWAIYLFLSIGSQLSPCIFGLLADFLRQENIAHINFDQFTVCWTIAGLSEQIRQVITAGDGNNNSNNNNQQHEPTTSLSSLSAAAAHLRGDVVDGGGCNDDDDALLVGVIPTGGSQMISRSGNANSSIVGSATDLFDVHEIARAAASKMTNGQDWEDGSIEPTVRLARTCLKRAITQPTPEGGMGFWPELVERWLRWIIEQQNLETRY